MSYPGAGKKAAPENHPVSTNLPRLFLPDGRPRPVGVIGYPVAHSLSPVFQNAAFQFHHLPHRYKKWEVSPADLPAFVRQVRSEGFLGLNITLPHKEAALDLVDFVSEEGAGAGSINTLFHQDAKLGGHTTDVAGFLEALEDENYSPAGQQILVIGAGGAARAVVYGLAKAGAAEIAIANRNNERAIELAGTISSQFPNSKIFGISMNPEEWPVNPEPRTLVVNATSLAFTSPGDPFPISPEALAGGTLNGSTIFFDLTYGNTPFLRASRESRAPSLDGLSMLVYQGAHSFELWTGLAAPRPQMLEAARAAMAAK